ncbi:hypothetical protein LIX60_31020 [Streptomyces sp. S07_1.15]|uniref:hypothetical protein n=1 Tax=Streptomyces sp. S07_1.15 TaxID=2873925 RepID=UPI001D158FAE|nr:hypothetical protein [Streptomyces sp. S07_1.15]MCC3655815.1 hypothetical protein [Streptomyces sp. S07_1.15]
MVNAGTYWLWQQLAVSDALPDEALPTVIEALCSTSLAPYGVDGRGEERRTKALADALPTLLSRVTRPGLRRQLLQQADDKQLAELADQGVVVAADLPTILRAHRPTPGLVIGLARHPDQVDAAIGLLPGMHDTNLEDVVTDWDPNRHRYRPDAESAPPIPPALFNAVLEHALTPLARLLQEPQHEGWQFAQRADLGLPHEFGEGAPWRILATCPDRWHDLVEHSTLGTAVQHLLLDQAEVEARRGRMMASSSSHLTQDTDDGLAEPPEPEPALDTALLRACLPALCLPEMADLPQPSVTARHRLHHIAQRVHYNPGLLDIAADQLHAAADECVRRGRLLTPPRATKDDPQPKTLTVIEDLAQLSANPAHLAKACTLLTTLEQPTVVSTPPSPRFARITEGTDLDTPVRLLERNYQHRRVATLLALASNPHTPRPAVTEALTALHPLELAWICHQNDVPDWLHTAAAGLAPADDTEAVLRLLTDDELDDHPDPGAVLQSWLDAPETDGVWTDREVYRAVLKSRHHTLHHLRQLPAGDVVTEPNLALPPLLTHCGNQPHRWKALLKALDYGPQDEKITFGQVLDSIEASSTGAGSPAGTGT